MRSGSALGVDQNYDIAFEETEGHEALFAVCPSNIFTRDREVVPDCIAPVEIKAMVSDVFPALGFVPGGHWQIVNTICRLCNQGESTDLTYASFGPLAGITHGPQRGAVEQHARVKVKHEYRGLGRGRIQFVEGRNALLGELEFRPTPDHAHPFIRRGAPRLLAQHAHRIGKRRHAVPSELEVVVQAPAYRVRVRIDQTGDHRAPVQS